VVASLFVELVITRRKCPTANGVLRLTRDSRATKVRFMKIVSRPALIRLGILFVLIAALLSWAGCTMIRMPLKSYTGPLDSLTGKEQAIRDELRRHVETLAGEIGERNVFLPRRLEAAAEYVETVFSNLGHTVTRHGYEAAKEHCENLEIEFPGNARPEEIVVIGAHYDSVHGCPGANDNASGVAALLALARLLGEFKPDRTLRLVAFANEEPPFFMTEQMGSLVYARMCRARGDNIVAMLSLETIGYYADAKRSQRYPFPLSMVYPSRGNFIAFVGNTASAGLVRNSIQTFREHAKFPSEGAALPGALTGIGWSDHWSFWQAGYAAVMVTDTAPFRYAHYHEETDTPDKLDYDRMARVVAGLDPVIRRLCIE
jgi:hypothetical protein